MTEQKPAIKKLRGRKILINIPILDQPKTKLELSPETQAELDKEFAKKLTRLEVFAVGNLVEDIEVGDVVYIGGSGLENAERIDINGEIKLMIDDYSANIIW